VNTTQLGESPSASYKTTEKVVTTLNNDNNKKKMKERALHYMPNDATCKTNCNIAMDPTQEM
jgi:hypothetical protein